MKRLQITIEADLDATLGRAARSEGTSKAALIRRIVREHLGLLPPHESDPIRQMAGVDEFDPEPVDDVVYR
jgi:hypothetical protein